MKENLGEKKNYLFTLKIERIIYKQNGEKIKEFDVVYVKNEVIKIEKIGVLESIWLKIYIV